MDTLNNLLLLSQLKSTIFGVYNNPNSRNNFATLCDFHGHNAVLCATTEEAMVEIGANHQSFQYIVTHMELAQANEFAFVHFVHQLNRLVHVTYNNDQTLQAFLDEATVHGAFNHLIPVRWIEDAVVPDFGILANIHAHYVQTPQGQQALGILNAHIPHIVNPPVAAQAEVPQNGPPVEPAILALDAQIPAEAHGQANPAIQIPLNAQIPPDFGILGNIYAQYVQTPQGQHALAMLNAHIPHNVNLPVAVQVEVPQGAPVEEPAIMALNAQIPAEAEANAQANAAIQILNAPVEEPAVQAPAVQHQDVDDDDIDTTLSLAPPAQRRRLE